MSKFDKKVQKEVSQMANQNLSYYAIRCYKPPKMATCSQNRSISLTVMSHQYINNGYKCMHTFLFFALLKNV